MNKVAIFALILSLFSAGTGLLVALYGPAEHLKDAHHLIGLGMAIFFILAITGSFKGGNNVKRQ